MPGFVPHNPIATTVVALTFSAILLRRFRQRGGTHQLWWSIGTVTRALGTVTEASVTLFGWNEGLFRAWYITGARGRGRPGSRGQAARDRGLSPADRPPALP